MSQPISTVNGPLFIARQSTIGTPATTNFKKFHRVSGKVATGKEAGKVDWLDGSRFANSFDYTASLQVTGSFTVKGSADAIASLASYALGTDVITGGSAPYTHTINPATTLPYLTIVTELGESGNNQIHEHSDVLITSLKIDSSSDNDVVMAEVEVVGINPGKTRSSLPSATSETEDPFLHYDAEDTFVFAGLNSGGEVKDISQCSLTILNSIEPYFGDSVRPTALVLGRGEITVDFTVLASDETLPLLNQYYYGTASPSTGTSPTADVFKDSFACEYSKGSGGSARSVAISIPELVFNIEEYPEADAGGSPIEIACTGSARIASGDTAADIITITAETADATSYSDGSSPGS